MVAGEGKIRELKIQACRLIIKKFTQVFLGLLVKLRTTTTGFVLSCLSVCPSVLPSCRMKQLNYHLRDFGEIRYTYLIIFGKSVEGFQVHKNLTRLTCTS